MIFLIVAIALVILSFAYFITALNKILSATEEE